MIFSNYVSRGVSLTPWRFYIHQLSCAGLLCWQSDAVVPLPSTASTISFCDAIFLTLFNINILYLPPPPLQRYGADLIAVQATRIVKTSAVCALHRVQCARAPVSVCRPMCTAREGRSLLV